MLAPDRVFDDSGLSWSALFAELEGLDLEERSYPYNYQDGPLIKVYVYGQIKGIRGYKTLQNHLKLRPDVLKLVGLERVPHRKTLAQRFRDLSETVLGLLGQLTQRFIALGMVDAYIASADSTLMAANGNIWHKKQMEQGELPKCGNIDTEAHWGVSGCGEWTFGYRLHCLTLCGVEGTTWPASIAVHAANIKDAAVFVDQLAPQLPQTTQVALGDGGYAQAECFTCCDQRQITLIVPIEVKKTHLLSGLSGLGSIKTPTFGRSSPSARPRSNLSKDNSKSFSTSNGYPSKAYSIFALSVTSPFLPTSS